MSRSLSDSQRNAKTVAENLFLCADKMRDRGDLRSAFRFFLAAAKAGYRAVQLDVGCTNIIFVIEIARRSFDAAGISWLGGFLRARLVW
jgi:hypothetical protein